ncbi:MAG: sugar-binding domain-containing protein [Planctomycetota bacterium]
MTRKIINLTDRPWTFRTDPSNDGLAQGWQREPQPSDEWKPIRVGQHWEGQGYESLDGWAWYRIEMELPDDWKDTELFLWIDGGDDYYEVFANGQKVGSAGNIEDKKTAFEIQSSFKLTSVSSGSKLAIAIRVYDWQGAGGMFRPIALSTTDRDSSLEILK